ncbi:ATP-binding cassette domain-containing protein [Actinomyces israelii]|uniref:ATP-binding cassette domain-containing protein n=1 Tax=Actinomyces israelii TaxID=1659 RepID=A0ABT4I4F4_9ACTO|nr:ATP-binding cassette domain-containing protein [Actinomyces israelii]MCZ0856616.1 ATP-binding cassette domain-containing protein [Actinomyces israelii]
MTAQTATQTSPSRASSPPAVETDGLTRTFGSFTAVDSLDLTIPTGIVYGLLGPNGAGKSTALRMITTLLAPSGGSARVLGHDVVAERHAVRSVIGVTGQYASVDEILTGVENLRLFGRLLGLGRRRARERADELLASFALTEAGGKRVSGYSGGMRRRLDLAVSLIAAPPLVFLDEPTTGLDPRTREQMWDVIRSLVAGGSTILLTTQYLEEADRLAHRIGIVDDGRLIAEGTADELKDRVGSSALVLTPAAPGGRAATAAIIERVTGRAPAIIDQGARLQTPLSEAAVATEVLVALRDAGLPPRTVSVDRPSMDSVFMALTGGPRDHSEEEPPAPAGPLVPPPSSSAARPLPRPSSARPSENREQS